MQTSAEIKYVRISPKKIKTLGKSITGTMLEETLSKLSLSKDKNARILSRAVKSAQNNAVNNSKMDKSKLFIKSVNIGKGPQFKRWQAVSRGMAHQIKKRTAHIKITVEEIGQKQVKVNLTREKNAPALNTDSGKEEVKKPKTEKMKGEKSGT